MKNNKKFILAAGAAALGLVAATGVTSGFAWFATNAQVSVNNMSILANSNNSYLLIHAGEVSKTVLQEGDNTDPEHPIAKGSTAINVSEAAPSLTPVTYVAGNTAADMATGTADLTASWKTGTSADWDDATLDGELVALDGALSNYVKTYTFTVGLAKGSADITGFGISSVTVQANKGLKVIIASPTLGYAFSATNATVLDSPLRTTTLTQNDVVVVKAYVYLEGSDTNVYSANAANLGGTISFTLKTPTPVTPAP